MKKIGALWKRQSKNKRFLAGELELIAGIKTKIMVFPNQDKKNPKAPDYHVVLATDDAPKKTSVETEDVL